MFLREKVAGLVKVQDGFLLLNRIRSTGILPSSLLNWDGQTAQTAQTYANLRQTRGKPGNILA